MELGLRDRVAFVGGSGKGMSQASALALAREGASVTICARDESALRKAELEIARTSSQHHVLAVPADLSRPDDIKRAVRGTFNRFGRLDIAVSHISGPRSEEGLLDINDEEWEEDVQQHFLSIVRVSREVVPYMKQQRWGRIIIRLPSLSAHPLRGSQAFESSRMAVYGYAKQLSEELASFNITVNSVVPGAIMTDGLASDYETKAKDQDQMPEEVASRAAKAVPIGRFGTVEEVGDLIAFLASERASYITGASIPMDGGLVHNHS
jgi:3-oxoacyl-[acyl-carrier protein] reductase